MRRLGAKPKAATAAAKPGAARRPRRRGWSSASGLTRAGLAVLALGVLVAGGVQLWRGGQLAALAGRLDDRLVEFSAHLGLAVADVEVEGRAMTSREAILRAVGAERGTPILAVSPSAAKVQLEALPWVRSAAVERRLPDTLHIRLVERQPLAFWQRQGKLALIDGEGVVITGERLDRFPGLIVVVGEDAPQHAAALLAMLNTQKDLAKRVSAAVRIGARRWNLHLDNGIDIELPEEQPEGAWAQLARLERDNRLLARNVQVVDMRLPDRLVVRLTPEPPKEPVRKARQGAKST